MRVFFLFLGLALGVNLGYCLDPASFLVAIFLSLFALFFSFKQKEALAFSIALAVGIALGLIRGPSSEGQCQLTGMVVRSSDNYFVVVSGFSRYYVGIKDHGYEIGDFLKLEGYVKPFVRTTYEAQFDFGAYLKSYGVTQEISYPKIENVFLNPLRFRTYELQFLSHFDENAASLLDSLLFNRKDYSSMPILLASSLNVMNLLSASGIFFSFLMRQVDKTTHRLIRKEKTGKLVSLGVSLFALPLALRKIGILRVILTRIVAYWNEYHYRGALKGFEVASLSGVIMIFLSRYAVFQSGFLLGFGSSLTLSFAQPLLRRGKVRRMPKLAGLLLLRLFFLPAAISFGGAYHVFGFAFSLLLIPPTYCFAAIGLFSYLSFPYPVLINPLGEAFTGMLKFLSSFDIVIYLPDDGIWAIFLYYCVFFVTLLVLELGLKGVAKGMALSTLSLYLVSLLPILS